MKVPLSWLKEYVELTVTPEELAVKLTMAGIEVGEIQVIGGHWDNVLIGRITAIEPHPNADRLRLPTVDLGTEQITVVCGAPNIEVGQKIAFARVGATLIDGHNGEMAVLKPAKIRGVASSGMVCSEMELGISDNHEGILVLPADAPVGTPLADYMGDVVLDLEVTPNRPDCLSIIGVAQEVAALTGRQLKLPEISYPEEGRPIGEQIDINIIDPDLCPRYTTSLVTDLKIGPSPYWMQRRLTACGTRPINNVVDVTNYIMYEYGQPLHAFDYELIRGKTVNVRRADEGEPLMTLDGIQRTLTGNMLVIADAERAMGLAGVMGGEDIEVTDRTTAILLESANFSAANIHYTSHSLSLLSEASNRYARGASPEITMPALKRATQLMIELAGGRAASGIIDIYSGRQERPFVTLTAAETKKVLGVDFGIDRIAGTLESLGFECEKTADAVSARPPYWRSDINIPYDMIEEVARIIGYDEIPTTLLSQPLPPHQPRPDISIKEKIENSLIGFGFQEIMSYAQTSKSLLDRAFTDPNARPVPVRLTNPMSVEQECLRTSLRAGLLAALAGNRRHEENAIRLFEIGRVFLPRHEDLPDQPEELCGLMGGPRFEGSWHGASDMIDFYDTKGVIEGLFAQLGIPVHFEAGRDSGLHPQKQAAIMVNGERVGVMGELHPRVALAFEISEPVYLFELPLATLIPLADRTKMYQPIPRFPAVVRDLALIVNSDITHRKVTDIIAEFPLVREVMLFDIYSGDPVPAGQKSMAYRLVFQSREHTLTDKEVDRVQQEILERLGKDLGASVRSG